MKLHRKYVKTIVKNTLISLFAAAVAISMVSCQNMQDGKQKTDKKDVKEEVKEAAETTQAYLSEEQQKILDQYEAQMDSVDRKINDLEDKMALAGQNVKQQLQKRIDTLEKRQERTQQRIDELADASGEAWENVRQGVDEAFKDLDKAIDDARKEFK